MLKERLAAGSALLLVLGRVSAQDALLNNTIVPANTTAEPPLSTGPNVVAIVVPIVVVLLLILTGALIFLFCIVKKKRQTEGTYMPSAEEQTGAPSVEAPNALKLPKEERLI
ncbi:protein crumbs homolog 3a [Trichomycterus rosablanca]|uniref:protein crumbs homolog 3a n=1 Tax=Trichomycterus rosablanca TaxID=2290929 RepID=UPI002F360BE9